MLVVGHVQADTGRGFSELVCTVPPLPDGKASFTLTLMDVAARLSSERRQLHVFQMPELVSLSPAWLPKDSSTRLVLKTARAFDTSGPFSPTVRFTREEVEEDLEPIFCLGQVEDEYTLSCCPPPFPCDEDHLLRFAVDFSLNGQDFTSDSLPFRYIVIREVVPAQGLLTGHTPLQFKGLNLHADADIQLK